PPRPPSFGNQQRPSLSGAPLNPMPTPHSSSATPPVVHQSFLQQCGPPGSSQDAQAGLNLQVSPNSPPLPQHQNNNVSNALNAIPHAQHSSSQWQNITQNSSMN